MYERTREATMPSKLPKEEASFAVTLSPLQQTGANFMMTLFVVLTDFW
jgi:hypothetical protein